MTTDDARAESDGGALAVSDADRPADLDTIITGALTVLDRAEPQDLYLPELAPSDQERVDTFAKRGRPRRRFDPTSPTGACSSPGASSGATVRCRRRRRQSRRS